MLSGLWSDGTGGIKGAKMGITQMARACQVWCVNFYYIYTKAGVALHVLLLLFYLSDIKLSM